MAPPTVVKDRDADNPVSFACWRRSNSAASIFCAQNLNLKNGRGAEVTHVRPLQLSTIELNDQTLIILYQFLLPFRECAEQTILGGGETGQRSGHNGEGSSLSAGGEVEVNRPGNK